MSKRRKNNDRPKKGHTYSAMMEYVRYLGFRNISDAIGAAGSGRKFRNAFKTYFKSKK